MGTYQKASELQRKLRGPLVKEQLTTHRAKILKIVIALIVLAVAGYFMYNWVNKPTANKQQTEAALTDAAKAGSTDATIAKLQQAYDDAANTEARAQAAYYLAAHYTVKNDHKNALNFYRKAEDFYKGQNIDVLLGIANEAEALKNKDLAKAYYQKAIDYYKAHPASTDTSLLIQRLQIQLNDIH